MSSKVTCEIIPLYKFEIYYNEDDDDAKDYSHVIVSDTIQGLIDGIVRRELIWSMKDCRKYLTVSDFLLMPCKESSKGYHLFDIDEVDCAGRGNEIQEVWYDCHFKNEKPFPVTYDIEVEVLHSKMAELHKNDPDMLHYGESATEGILASALYDSKLVQESLTAARERQKIHEAAEQVAGERALLKLMERERG